MKLMLRDKLSADVSLKFSCQRPVEIKTTLKESSSCTNLVHESDENEEGGGG